MPSFVSTGPSPPHPAVSLCSERGHHFTNPGTACSCAGSVQQHFLQLYCSDFGRQNSFLCSQSSFYIFSILCLVFPPKLALMISCHSKNNNNHLQGDSSATIGFETSVKICENKIKSAFLQEPPFPPAEVWPSLHTTDSALCPPPACCLLTGGFVLLTDSQQERDTGCPTPCPVGFTPLHHFTCR